MPIWNEELQQWGYLYHEEVSSFQWQGISRNKMENVEYVVDSEQARRIENTFTYHKPKNDQPRRYETIRDQAKDLAYIIVKNTPVSREQSLALTHLEAAIFYANAAIARNE